MNHHGVAVRLDFVPVKSRLNKPPLLQPRVSFAGQQPISEYPAIESKRLSLNEVPMLGQENVFNQIWVV
jgi:hypothetical protein